MRPHVLIYDASPGLGGALTGVAALVPVLRASGWRITVAATTPAPWRDAVDTPVYAVNPSAPLATTGSAYLARERARARGLRQVLRETRPDVVLANNAPTTNAAAYRATLGTTVPVVQYLRAVPGPSRLGRLLVGRAQAVLTVGTEASAWAMGAGVRPVPVEEGLAPGQWPTRRAAGARRWLWAGSGLPWKGLDLLRDAWPALPKGPALDVCVAPQPGQPAVRLHPDWVRHPSHALGDRWAETLLFIHTALRPEPFGRVVLEAMAAGLCPVAPDVGGPKRLIQHGRTGLLYRAGDRHSLTEALSQVAASPRMADALGQAASQRALAYRAATVFRPVEQALRLAAA